MDKLKINIKKNNSIEQVEIEKNTSCKKIVNDYYDNNSEIVLLNFSGVYKELCSKIDNEGTIEPIFVTSEEGFKVYERTLQYIFLFYQHLQGLDQFPAMVFLFPIFESMYQVFELLTMNPNHFA